MIGRDDELGTLGDALARLPGGARAVVVEGEPGIGKTILWEAALADAASRGYRVLRASGAQSEVQLLLGALGDLLQDVHDVVLPPLPAPQRHALAVALLLEESEEQPDLRALAVAFLSALRELAASEPAVVAVDDVQWLDATTFGLLLFAARRLAAEPVLFLFTCRADETAPTVELERAVGPGRLEQIEVGPLTVGAVGELLRDRLGAGFPRPVLLRLHETSGGNPFFALELARALQRRGLGECGRSCANGSTHCRTTSARRCSSRRPPPSRRLLSSEASILHRQSTRASSRSPTGGSASRIRCSPRPSSATRRWTGCARCTHSSPSSSPIRSIAPVIVRRPRRGPTSPSPPRSRAPRTPPSAAARRPPRASCSSGRSSSPTPMTTPPVRGAPARRGGYYTVVGDGVRGGELMRLGVAGVYTSTDSPYDLAVNSEGDLWVAYSYAGVPRIERLNVRGSQQVFVPPSCTRRPARCCTQ